MQTTYELQSWNHSCDLVDQEHGLSLVQAKITAKYLLDHDPTLATVVIYDDDLREAARFNREDR